MNDLIKLRNLSSSTFRFYLKDKFRFNIFNKLLNKHKSLGGVAKSLNINRRSLFGIRRGWELRNGFRKIYHIRPEWLFKIKDELNLTNKVLEKNVVGVNHSTSKTWSIC